MLMDFTYDCIVSRFGEKIDSRESYLKMHMKMIQLSQIFSSI